MLTRHHQLGSQFYPQPEGLYICLINTVKSNSAHRENTKWNIFISLWNHQWLYSSMIKRIYKIDFRLTFQTFAIFLTVTEFTVPALTKTCPWLYNTNREKWNSYKTLTNLSTVTHSMASVWGKKMSTKKSKTSNKQGYIRGYLGYIVFLVNKHTCTYI